MDVDVALASCMAHPEMIPPYSPDPMNPANPARCYVTAAKNSEDITYCDDILELTYQSEEDMYLDYENCVGGAGYWGIGLTVEDCNELSHIRGKETCYIHASVDKNDESICELITDTIKNAVCRGAHA